MLKDKHSTLYWLVLIIVTALFGLVVFAQYWMYRLGTV